MKASSILAGIVLPLIACQSEPIQVYQCGDGVADATEECDDANAFDGDGCSAECVVETPAPQCFEILGDLDTRQRDAHVTADGRVLIAGDRQLDGEFGAWAGAVDTRGTTLWSLDVAPDEDEKESPFAYAIRPRGDGFVFLHHHSKKDREDLVTVDGTGNILDMVTLDTKSLVIHDVLAVDAKVLFAGSNGEDAWLGRLGQGGELETVSIVDVRGLRDDFHSLRRHGEVLGALVVGGVANHGDDEGDDGEFDIQSTLLLEYDEQGVEQRRTILAGADDHVSLIGSYLAVTADGTWIIAGTKNRDAAFDQSGWAAAVRDGEVIWMFESPGMVEIAPSGPGAFFYTGVATQDVLLAGEVHTKQGVRPWLVRLDGDTGVLEAEHVGEPASAGMQGRYTSAGMTEDGRVWLVGSTATKDRAVQWLCSTSL